MGVVNVTPDSFSDGGLYFEPKTAIEGGLRMLDEGADILDLGGESTRPGTPVASDADAAGNPALVSAEEELRRVLPVLRGLRRARPDAVISVDTYKSAVARAALAEGAEIVNDVSGLQWDGEMAATCGELGCGLVLMHTRGTPKEWRKLPPEPEIASLVEHDLANRLQVALERGIARNRIVIDPGFGFGKNYEENYSLLAHLSRLQHLGFPILAGTSRKGFIGRAMARRIADLRAELDTISTAASVHKDEGPFSSTALGPVWSSKRRVKDERETSFEVPMNERLYGSLAAMTASILQGAHIVRVHDVRAAVEAAAVADEVLHAGESNVQ
jgi:dihydropteroate synthase